MMNHNIRNSKRALHGIFVFYCMFLVVACSSKNNIENAPPPQTKPQDIEIYLDSTAQTIRGFGAANVLLWRPDMTNAEINTAFGTGKGQLGFSILRIMLEPDPSRWSLYVPTAKKAHDMGAKIIASPWYAPSEMVDTVNGETRLRPDRYGAYAAHIDSFYTYMKNNGVPIYGISVQNEPDISDNWTSWSPDEMLAFMKDYADSIKGPKVMAPESFHFDPNYSDPILDNSAASANTDIICGHIYGGGLVKQTLAEEKGKEVWMTEHFTESKHSGNDWPLALDVATEMQSVMRADMNAYIWWYIVRYYGPIGDGEMGTTAGQVTKRGYIMSQFARFIRPGYVRVHTYGPTGVESVNESGDLFVTAYKDATSKTVVIVAENSGTSSAQVNVTINGAASATFHPYVTSATQNAEEENDIKAASGSFTATLPAQSITTFVSNDVDLSP